MGTLSRYLECILYLHTCISIYPGKHYKIKYYISTQVTLVYTYMYLPNVYLYVSNSIRYLGSI